jgi:hypothetical protein
MSDATSGLNEKEHMTRMGRETIFLFLVTGKESVRNGQDTILHNDIPK